MITVEEKITRTKIQMRLKNFGFFSFLLSHFIFINTDKTETISVSAKREIRYNPEFVSKLNDNQCLFLLAHEVLHYALMHLTRVGSRNNQIANIAMDIKVNDILVTEQIGEPICGGLIPKDHSIILPGNLFIIDINTKTWEEIYDELSRDISRKKNNNDNNEGNENNDNNEGNENNDDNNDKELLESRKKNNNDNNEGNENNDNNEGNENNDDNNDKELLEKGRFDQHEFSIDEEEITKIENQINRELRAAITSQERGFASNDLSRLAQEILNPHIDWRILLHRFLQPYATESYTFKRPNRRFISQNIILPGMNRGEMINGLFVIDTSGSMSDKIMAIILSEMLSIIKSFKAIKLRTLVGDYKLKEDLIINNEEDVKQLKMLGGEGTSHEFMYEFLSKNNPTFCVAFTDGFSDIETCHSKYNHNTKILWLVPKGAKDLSRYGTQVWIDLDKYK